jgi:isopropylmalate/homocitrate/citramalate synthase
VTADADNGDNVSPLNLVEAVRRGLPMPAAILVNDVTLREAEQSPGISFSIEVKVALARRLESAGVSQVQVGYPGLSSEQADAATAVVDAMRSTRVEVGALAFVEDWRGQIDACISTGASIVHVTNRTSQRLHAMGGISPQEVLERTDAAVRYAARRGHEVTFGPSDSTRTDIAFLREAWKTAANAGATRIYVTDSVGVATPELVRHLVELAQETAGVSVGVHCHNDFGLAVANTLAGVAAGASIVDVAVNGLGDRAGNTSMEETVAALHLLYGTDTGITLAALTSISEAFAVASGRVLHDNKPITGRDVFTHVLPGHVAAIKADPLSMQPFRPELVGNVQRLLSAD